MKNLLARLALAAALSGLLLSIQPVLAQGTAFTYQGQLNFNGVPANGLYDFQFSLSNAPSGGSQIGSTVTALALGVTNGLFTTNLDFGAVFTGNPTWLAISVCSNGLGSYTALTPLQELNPAPYAIFANTASNFSGTLPAVQLSGPIPLAQLPATISLLSDPGSPGSDNFFAGQYAGNASLSGVGNTGVGAGVLAVGGSSGVYNTAVGLEALAFDSSGSYNSAFGVQALEWNQTGSYNTATGYNAMANLPAFVTGNYNTADGVSALTDVDSGSNNTAIGVEALAQNLYGNNNTALGYFAGKNITGSSNIDIGNAGVSSDNAAIRIGDIQTATYIAGTIALDGNDTNNGLVYASAGLVGVPGGGGTFLYGYNGGSLGTVSPTEINLSWDYSGNVWVSNNLSADSLTVRGNFAVIDGANAANGNGPIDAYIGGNGSGSDVQIGSMNSSIANVAFYNWGNSTYMHVYCSSITIEGGADLAEPFEVSSPSGEIPQGAVVVIDEESPGRLKVSSRPYDTRVAGVLSGANGVNPGIQMQQQGLMEGGKNVALTGRVYVQADASNGAIKPGDLLTTSSAPGRAMRVTDHAKAQGAILGKAMTALKEGQGMVLVLVTLQ
jgi:hypothetical protein